MFGLHGLLLNFCANVSKPLSSRRGRGGVEGKNTCLLRVSRRLFMGGDTHHFMIFMWRFALFDSSGEKFFSLAISQMVRKSGGRAKLYCVVHAACCHREGRHACMCKVSYRFIV
ncbi:unnamed protein product [Ectocarpus sp. 13 AM-2016]